MGFLHSGWRSLRSEINDLRIQLSQAPIVILNLVVVAVKFNIQLSDEIQQRPLLDKLRRMDYLGSITLAGALGCFFLAINFGVADEMQWTRPLVILLFASSACLAFSFVMIELYWAPYPLLPSRVFLRRAPLAIFLSSFFLSMTVFSMVSYFTHCNLPCLFLTHRCGSFTAFQWCVIPPCREMKCN